MLCGICGGQSATVTGFHPSILASICQTFHYAPHSFVLSFHLNTTGMSNLKIASQSFSFSVMSSGTRLYCLILGLPKDLSLNFNYSVLPVAFVVLILCRWPNICSCSSCFLTDYCNFNCNYVKLLTYLLYWKIFSFLKMGFMKMMECVS